MKDVLKSHLWLTEQTYAKQTIKKISRIFWEMFSFWRELDKKIDTTHVCATNELQSAGS